MHYGGYLPFKGRSPATSPFAAGAAFPKQKGFGRRHRVSVLLRLAAAGASIATCAANPASDINTWKTWKTAAGLWRKARTFTPRGLSVTICALDL
jgi:hypothetical protein